MSFNLFLFLSTFSWLLTKWYWLALCTYSCSPCFNWLAVLMNLGHISHHFRPLCHGCDRPYYALPFDDIFCDVSCTCIVDYLVLIFVQLWQWKYFHCHCRCHCHQMEALLNYWLFVRGIHRSPMNCPHKGRWRGALIFFIYAWINGWINNPEDRDLRYHRAHYDVTVMHVIPESQ